MRIQKYKKILLSKQMEIITLTQKKRVFSRFSIEWKGSMTLEACLVLPIFLFFFMTLLMGIEITRTQSSVWASLCMAQSSHFRRECFARMNFTEEPEKEDLLKTVQNDLLEQKEQLFCLKGKVNVLDESDRKGRGWRVWKAEYEIKPFLCWLPISNTPDGSMPFQDSMQSHDFCGYYKPPDEEGGRQQEIYVYVTKTGSRYHENQECTSLLIHPEAVPFQELPNRRNEQGAKYAPCERCRPSGVQSVFVTKDGTRYHQDVDCSALKRTVYMVTKKEAMEDGKTACGRCHKNS